MLRTNLKHLNSDEELQSFIKENENVMICCGRMGPMCIPVYGAMEQLEKNEEYSAVKFADLDFDVPAANFIRLHPACRMFTGLPFTIYFKNGEVTKATSSIQTKKQVSGVLDEVFK
ncbi:thioredoxin [bacterium]|nr:thioredoxin [bacterium]